MKTKPCSGRGGGVGGGYKDTAAVKFFCLKECRRKSRVMSRVEGGGGGVGGGKQFTVTTYFLFRRTT